MRQIRNGSILAVLVVSLLLAGCGPGSSSNQTLSDRAAQATAGVIVSPLAIPIDTALHGNPVWSLSCAFAGEIPDCLDYHLRREAEASNARAWHDAGFSKEEADEWKPTGFSSRQALQWREGGFGPTAANAWNTDRFSPQDAGTWKRSGFEPGAAQGWHDNHFSAVDALAWQSAGLTPAEGAAWRDQNFSPIEAKRWSSADLTPDYRRYYQIITLDQAIALHRAGLNNPGDCSAWGLTIEDLFEWSNQHFTCKDASSWKGSGFSPAAARQWSDEGLTPGQVKTAEGLLRSGYSRTKAITYAKQNLSFRQAEQQQHREHLLGERCHGRTEDYRLLLVSNPYSLEGKCFDDVFGVVYQWFGPTEGLANLYLGVPTVRVTFDKRPAANTFRGLAIARAPFQFEDTSGALRTIVSLELVE
jgi:hypothetical protein